jgi:DNA-binding transcriptional LysR family regulator
METINDVKLRRLDFGLLLVFQELYRRGRSTAAAERLRLSQPAVSHALGRLRELFGDPLFVRRPGGMLPTARAAEIAPKVDALLALASEAVDGPLAFDPASSRRIFRVSAPDFAGSLLAAPLIGALAASAPGTRLSLSFSGGPAAAFQALRNGDLDVAIGRFPDLPADCIATRLFEEDYQVIARRRHKRLRNGLDLGTYLALDHLIVSFAGDLKGTIDEDLARVGLSRRIAAASPMFLNAFAVVAATDLIATTPRRLALRFGAAFKLTTFELPFRASRFIVDLVRARRSFADPALDWLVRQIADAMC